MMILHVSPEELKMIQFCLGREGQHEKPLYKKINTILQDKERTDAWLEMK